MARRREVTADFVSRLGDEASPRGRLAAASVSLLSIGAVLWPVVENWRQLPRDGFPLSYYPMFSAKRPQLTHVTCIVGYDAAGQRRLISFRYAGHGGHNQVRRQIRRMADEGRAAELCERIIGDLRLQKPNLLRGLVRIEVATGTYDIDDYFGGGSRDPLREKVHAVYDLVHDMAPGTARAKRGRSGRSGKRKKVVA